MYIWVCRATTHSSCKGLELEPGKFPRWSRPWLLQASCRRRWRWLLGVPSTGSENSPGDISEKYKVGALVLQAPNSLQGFH